MKDSASYFFHPRTRPRFGWLYRCLWLYPRLCRHLPGKGFHVRCGIGDMLRYRPGTEGVDMKSQCLDVHVISEDQLHYSDIKLDRVVLDNVLEHRTGPDGLLAEIRRVLVAGGALVVGVPGKLGYASDPDHKVYYDGGSLLRLLQGAGFVQECPLPMLFAWGLLDLHLRQYCLYGVFRRV